MPLRIAALERLRMGDATANGATAAALPATATVATTHHPSPRRHQHHGHHHHRPLKHHPHHPRQPRPPRPPSFGPPDDARSFFWGTVGFGALAYVAGAAPWALPLVFLAFFFFVLPLRAVDFWRRKWQFFLIDYCYFAAAAAAAFLLFAPDDPRIEAAVYALTEGPLAAALAAWQCRLQFGSLEHTVSTHLHLLPGLAIVAHRYAAPSGVRGWRAIAGHLRATATEAGEAALAAAPSWLGLGGGAVAPPRPRERSWNPWTGTVTSSTTPHTPIFRLFRPPEGPLPTPTIPQPVLPWAVAAPLAFYCAWQLAYFVVVQVLLRDLILREGYDTSYTCLARRAQRNNNVWNRIVRKGSALRRCAAYGGLQLAFTVATVVGLALPSYLGGPRAGALVQLIKVAVPLWYGSLWQCVHGAPKRSFEAGVRWQKQQEQGGQRGRDGEDGAEEDGRLGGEEGNGSMLERVLSDGVLMAAGLGSGDGARDAIAGGGGDSDDEETTSGLRRPPAVAARPRAAFEPLREEEHEGEAAATRGWGGGPVARLLQRRRRKN